MESTPAAKPITRHTIHSLRAFEDHILPHLDKAHGLARHLTRNNQDALDVVQEAYLRALRSYHGFRGVDARPWILEIVRNVFYTSLRQSQSRRAQAHFESGFPDNLGSEQNPESALIESMEQRVLKRSIDMLPGLYREVLVLRELEELPYNEISRILKIPIGTVMSRLSRARKRLRDCAWQTREAETHPRRSNVLRS